MFNVNSVVVCQLRRLVVIAVLAAACLLCIHFVSLRVS